MRVLVTGANGFVGRHFCWELASGGHAVRAAVRRPISLPAADDVVVVRDIGPESDWVAALANVDAVVHLAARVHVMSDTVANPLAAFRQVNVEGTRRLATACTAQGVRRLVYVSSIKVNGEGTRGERRFREADPPAPQDPYAVSKWEAERVLHDLAMRTELETVIVRPPLVYGPGVKGNLLRLLGWLDRGIPLPLRSVHNARSMVSVRNLASLLRACLEHSAAAGETFLAADGDDLSTPRLIRTLAEGLGRRPWLLPCPPPLLRRGARLVGRESVVSRLCDSLRIDTGRARRLLGWSAVERVDEGLYATARAYRKRSV